MAWTAPKTFTSGSVLLFSELNTYLRDNLNQTFPALATTDNQYLVSTGANAPGVRSVKAARVETAETFVSAGGTFGDCATVGPTVSSVTTGTRALIFVSCCSSASTANPPTRMGFAVSGATTSGASTNQCFSTSDPRTPAVNCRTAGCMVLSRTDLTAGSNTFTAKYQIDSGTATFQHRELIVMPF